MSVEITGITKIGGPLTKRIVLAEDGGFRSDGSACVMSTGAAQRVQIVGIDHLAHIVGALRSDQAIALGALRSGLPDKVQIVTKNKLNGAEHTIARTNADIQFQEGRPAFVLLDYDTKAMPEAVAERLRELGGFYEALISVLPELATVARVTRRSTSAGLYRADTGEKLRGSDGQHVYLAVKNGADSERFLKALHERCWLAGLGWLMVGKGGQLLERSIIDRMVGSPERLVFEGAPVVEPPLAQDTESRRPVATTGKVLDTIAACPPLTLVEMARARELKTKHAHRLAPESAKARTAFITGQAEALAARKGISAKEAAQVIERQCDGVLLPDLELPFDQEEFAGCTVADVLADPERFAGATLADPIEGVSYGRCVAKIMQRADGVPWINSFAHGHTVYRLVYDSRAVRAAMESADAASVVATFVKLAAVAELTEVEIEDLRTEANARSKIGKRAITATLKAARQDQAKRQRREDRDRRTAERHDIRPAIEAPEPDAPWLPIVATLNEVHATAVRHPPVRDIDTESARTARIAVADTHAFTTANAPEEP
jgi:hypothetical protein